jgi:hypothetical protein
MLDTGENRYGKSCRRPKKWTLVEAHVTTEDTDTNRKGRIGRERPKGKQSEGR